MNQPIYQIDTERACRRTSKRKHYENLNNETWFDNDFPWGGLV